MKKLCMIPVLSGMILLAILGFTVKDPRQGGMAATVKRGSAVYTQFCLTCHQANGGGVPNMNPPLIKTKWVLGDKKELIKVIMMGLSGEIEINGDIYQNAMPPHNFLTDQQVADVLTYVRNSFGNKASAVTISEVKASRARLKA